MHLVRPTTEYQTSFLAAIRDIRAEKPDVFFWDPGVEPETQFYRYVRDLNSFNETKNLPEAWMVPNTTFWLIDDEKTFVGHVNVRHRLTERLRQHGGHIGYTIAPAYRKRGYGTIILKLTLREAQKLDITRALVTCDDDNIGSYKIIEANGGILEDKIEWEGTLTRRYWIDLS